LSKPYANALGEGRVMNNSTAPFLVKPTEPQTPSLALRPRDAARAMGISERTLWAWAHSADDPVPHFRIGRVILFPTNSLKKWLAKQVEKATDERDCDGGQPCNGEDAHDAEQ